MPARPGRMGMASNLSKGLHGCWFVANVGRRLSKGCGELGDETRGEAIAGIGWHWYVLAWG